MLVFGRTCFRRILPGVWWLASGRRGGQLEEVAAVVVSKRGGAVTEVVIGP